MADNRATVKSNITTLNVPSVTNEILNEMLKDEMCDNLVFQADVVKTQSSTATSITCDFTGFDRINLTRTGGSLNITVAGISDGAVKWLLITKTSGQSISWIGVLDCTSDECDVLGSTKILYRVVRKDTGYYAEAVTAKSSDNLPKCSQIQRGLVEWATENEIYAGTDIDLGGDPMCVRPSLFRNNAIFFTNLNVNRTLFNGVVVSGVLGRRAFIWSKTSSPNGWVLVNDIDGIIRISY